MGTNPSGLHLPDPSAPAPESPSKHRWRSNLLTQLSFRNPGLKPGGLQRKAGGTRHRVRQCVSRPTHACPRGRRAKPPSHRLNSSLAGRLGVPGFSVKISASSITELKKKSREGNQYRQTHQDSGVATLGKGRVQPDMNHFSLHSLKELLVICTAVTANYIYGFASHFHKSAALDPSEEQSPASVRR